jgi:predicted tellurium resistance membrane protein TerC
MYSKRKSIYLAIYLSICLSVCLSVYLCLYSPLLELDSFFGFLILYTFRRTPRTGDQSVARPLPRHRTTETQNEHTQKSMAWVGFEPMITAFERAKAVHALDHVTTVIGIQSENMYVKFLRQLFAKLLLLLLLLLLFIIICNFRGEISCSYRSNIITVAKKTLISVFTTLQRSICRNSTST